MKNGGKMYYTLFMTVEPQVKRKQDAYTLIKSYLCLYRSFSLPFPTSFATLRHLNSSSRVCIGLVPVSL